MQQVLTDVCISTGGIRFPSGRQAPTGALHVQVLSPGLLLVGTTPTPVWLCRNGWQQCVADPGSGPVYLQQVHTEDSPAIHVCNNSKAALTLRRCAATALKCVWAGESCAFFVLVCGRNEVHISHRCVRSSMVHSHLTEPV